MAMRVEPADVDIAQVHMMDRDIASDLQARLFRRPDARDSFVRRQPCQMHVHAGYPHELENRLERDGLAAYCSARSMTCVSASAASACENAMQPASMSSPISVIVSPFRPTVSAPMG